MTGRLLTAREVADRLGLRTAATVLRWMKQGKLTAIRLPGGALRYREDDLDACFAAWETTGPTMTSTTEAAPDRRLEPPNRGLTTGDVPPMAPLNASPSRAR